MKQKADVVDLLDRLPNERSEAKRAVIIGLCKEAEVVSPKPLSGKERPSPEWPKPLVPEAFHGPAGEIVRLLEPHTEADPAALLFGTLTGFGNLAGANAHFRAESDVHHPRLFATLVGETAKGRKGTSWGRVRHLLDLAEPRRPKEQTGLTSGEGLIWAVRDRIEKQQPTKKQKGSGTCYEMVEVDPGIHDKRLLVIESELASTLRVMGRDGNTLSALMRNAWDRGDLQTLAKNAPATATGAHVSIIGHITRDELLRNLDATETANGFANRFLWICVRRSKALPDGGNLRDSDLEPIATQIGVALDFAREPRELKRDDAARELWREMYPTLSEGLPGMLGAVTSRAEAQVMRIALIYALLDRSEAIRLDHLIAGLACWDYAFASARYIFGDSTGDPVADELVSALEGKPGGMTRNEIYEHFGKHKSRERLERVIATLSAMGRVRIETEETGGRPRERVLLV
jgi:hypothetical protein